MDTTTLLLYVIAASAVTIIPGPTMLLALHNGASSSMRVCSQAQGFVEDYRHERLLLSKNAKNEIWPLLENWRHQHAHLSAPQEPAAAFLLPPDALPAACIRRDDIDRQRQL